MKSASPLMEDQLIWLRLFGSNSDRSSERGRVAGAMYTFDRKAKNGTDECDRIDYFRYLDIERAKQRHRVLMRSLHVPEVK
jgi:hypothetical protein